MTATSAGFGLRPLNHPSGIVRSEVGTIASGYANNIGENAPIAFASDGTIALAAAGGNALGSFQGCEFTPSDGRRRVSNFWPAAQVATEIVAYFTRDSAIVYEIQADATLAQTNVGNDADWTANGSSNLSTVTGISTVQLDASTASAAQAGLHILGFSLYPDNEVGDAFPIVQVRINESQLAAPVAGI